MNFFDDIMYNSVKDKNHTLDHFRKTIESSEKVLKHMVGNSLLPHKGHDVIIFLIYRKCLEQLDGLYILLKHESYSSAVTTLRAFFESYVGLTYILLNEEQHIIQRARAYEYFYKKEQLEWARNGLKLKDNLKPKTKEQLQSTIDNITKDFKCKRYLDIHKEFKRTKYQRKIKNPKWYTLFDGPKSFTALSKIIDSAYHGSLYSFYSQEAHGYQALADIEQNPETKKFAIKPLRGMKENSMGRFFLANSLMSFMTAIMIKRYSPEILEDYYIFFKSK